ncbi:putative tRNA(Ile)-lysidine synthase [Pseudocercospora fuligena]|uniref:tRNA(Ile)-lysidine synthetase n=1 Tax=Pseudocercospora fuligena TaxID=685502 RepID=A0A8H6VBJ4_9PEZI|nr:putative tRNA(Ile)-lysidine synthase [Pseudocercospora fuligena]
MLENVSGVAKAAALKALRADVYKYITSLTSHGGDRLGPPRLGLAISGGVDSMALATICACYRHGVERDYKNDVNFSGYIVDHGYRSESSDEAENVARELTRIGVRPRVLKLDWSSYGDPKSVPNFESVARRLRYQAIGRACFRDRISSVLVAHHADDQAETILARMHQKYYGHGLKGIKTSGKFPECEGIYGVDGSGDPYFPAARHGQDSEHFPVDQAFPGSKDRGMAVERGGLVVHRPLLNYSKDDLIAICEELDVNWFEDHTNADRTLTLRNAIRHLNKQDCLPAALQKKSLLALSSRLLQSRQTYEDRATELFNSIAATLDLASGSVSFSLSPDFRAGLEGTEADSYVLALLLRKLLLLVAPRSNISLTELDLGVDLVFSNLDIETFLTTGYLHIAEVNIHRSIKHKQGRVQYKLDRAAPIKRRSSDFEICWPEGKTYLEKGVRWSQWTLWDNRYWIRVGHFGKISPDPGLKIAVTFFASTHLAKARRSLPKWQYMAFQKRLRIIPGSIHGTLPAIITKRPVGGDVGTGVVEEEVEIMAMPTLRWNNPKFKLSDQYWQHDHEMRQKLKSIPSWLWEIRYREVDFSGKEHKIVDSTLKPEQSMEKAKAEDSGAEEESR